MSGFDNRQCPDAVVHPALALVEVEAEIIVGYVAPFAREDKRPIVAIRCGEWWLRYSRGPKTGTFWDMYGEDFHDVELATKELAKAPPVPRGKPYVKFVIPLSRAAGSQSVPRP